MKIPIFRDCIGAGKAVPLHRFFCLYLKNEENYYSLSVVLHRAFMGTGGF